MLAIDPAYADQATPMDVARRRGRASLRATCRLGVAEATRAPCFVVAVPWREFLFDVGLPWCLIFVFVCVPIAKQAPIPSQASRLASMMSLEPRLAPPAPTVHAISYIVSPDAHVVRALLRAAALDAPVVGFGVSAPKRSDRP